ncbi:DUF4105 domain-containing protein [Halobacteriovorax sp. HLS]|uniref:Lnb N-terminal periplasmic domain-containing protein n=1 Tax=Halobacteriovorax sp. HLS TaxID=2234000 RepID=UPI000FDC4337|nr:DUF4105 domain-containing protein [Halobacteriovorax sp. HLS]
MSYHLKNIVLIIITFVSFETKVFSQNYQNKLIEVSNSSYWKKLLHYEEGFFSSSSLADSDTFFLSKNGRDNLLEELEANIEAFKKIESLYTPEKMPAQCAFPERFNFIKNSFSEIKFKEAKCPDFQKWKKAVVGESVSLVFASAYVNNPSSMFGHTFLKFNQRNVEKLSEDMFNYVVAFSAHSDSSPGFLYALKGLFGGYKGVINVKPFYQTMKEYSKVESRDLWEYELNLDKDEIDSILNHLWEIFANTNFDYYFFDENCTSVLARILDLVSVDISYVENMRGYSLPTELVRTLSDSSKVGSVRYHPSLRKIFWAHYNKLSDSDKEDFHKLVKKEVVDTNAQVYQAVIHYYDYMRHDHENAIDENFAKYQKEILSKAAKAGRSSEIAIDTPISPDQGHLPAKVGLLLGKRNKDTVNSFQIRPLYHGLNDTDKGHEPWSAIEVLKLDFNFNHDQNNVGIENLTIVDVQSLPNFSFLDKNISWDLSLQVNPMIEDYKESSLKTSFSMKLGVSKQNSRFLFSTLIGAKVEAHEFYENFFRVGPHLKLVSGFLIGKSKLLANVNYFHSLVGKGELSKRYYYDYSLGLSIPVSTQGVFELKSTSNGRLGTFKDSFDSYSAGVSIYY